MDKLVAENGMGRRKTWTWNTFRLNFRSAIFHFGKTKSSVSLKTELKCIFKALKCHKSFFHLKVLIAKASLAFDLLSFSYFDIVLLEKLLPRHRILKYCNNTQMEKKKRKFPLRYTLSQLGLGFSFLLFVCFILTSHKTSSARGPWESL